jgi:tetratricopeptide (TPR) repeat protein
MTTPEINLAPSSARRLPRPGAARRAWAIVALGAVLTLAFAGALEYANRANLREQLQMPLSEVETGALRDLNTAIDSGEVNPFGGTALFERVADRHPNSPAAAHALWTAHIQTFDREAALEMAVRAAEIAGPDNPRYAIYVGTAARALNRADRQATAVALLEDALQQAPAEQQERLQKTLESVRGDAGDGD